VTSRAHSNHPLPPRLPLPPLPRALGAAWPPPLHAGAAATGARTTGLPSPGTTQHTHTHTHTHAHIRVHLRACTPARVVPSSWSGPGRPWRSVWWRGRCRASAKPSRRACWSPGAKVCVSVRMCAWMGTWARCLWRKLEIGLCLQTFVRVCACADGGPVLVMIGQAGGPVTVSTTTHIHG
jgi:hypothetical protein